MSNKSIYSIELQHRILEKAKQLVLQRYRNDKSILGIYIGGSIVDGTFGRYNKPVHQHGGPREGSDIDVGLVIKDRLNPIPLPEEDQRHYGVRHIGRTQQIPVYRMVDDNGNDIFLHGIHPIDLMIVTKDIYEGWLSRRYKWDEKGTDFAELAKKSLILKETDELRVIRERYVR